MVRYRSVLALILVIVTTFLVSCSSPSAVKVPPTYSTAQIEQIQASVPDMQALRDRMKEIPTLLQRREWIDIGNFVHGPLAELRYTMNNVTRKLLPEDREKARNLTRDFFDQLVKIDQAAKVADARKVLSNYQEALSDIDSFLNLLPQAVQELETES